MIDEYIPLDAEGGSMVTRLLEQPDQVAFWTQYLDMIRLSLQTSAERGHRSQYANQFDLRRMQAKRDDPRLRGYQRELVDDIITHIVRQMFERTERIG